MSRLANLWSKLVRTESQEGAHVLIPTSRVLGADAPTASFAPHRSYFELRLKQMLLRDEREYFRTFVPLASFNAEFMFGGRRVQTPLVIGPSLLTNVERLSQGDQVEFLNARLLGPCPYEGDDIELFAGLFRLTTNDWAQQTLGLLELLTKTFDTSKLSTSFNLATPLAAGIESFFGMKDVEFRLGKHINFSAPAGAARQGDLEPAHLALLRLPRSQLSVEQAQQFWVREGRLCYGPAANALEPYTGSDFMLLDIAPLASRTDYSSFDFHRNYWRKIEDLLVEQKTDEALETFRLLAASIAQCDDIVRTHRFRLLRQYRAWIDDSIAEYEQLFSPSQPTRSTSTPAPAPASPTPPPGASRPRRPPADVIRSGRVHSTTLGPGSGPGRRQAGPVGEADLAAAIANASDLDAEAPTPEQMFAAVLP